MTMFPSDLRLGCLIQADPKKDEWFAQIVEQTGPGVLDTKVVASALGSGRDGALRKVCAHAGIQGVPPPRAFHHTGTPVGVVSTGLMAAMKRCEIQLHGLIGDLREAFGWSDQLDMGF